MRAIADAEIIKCDGRESKRGGALIAAPHISARGAMHLVGE